MAYQEQAFAGSSPQSRPITPLSNDGYNGDIDSSPEGPSIEDYFVDDDGPTPRAKKRLTAIKEGSPQEECSDYETAEEKSMECDEETAGPPVRAEASKPDIRTVLRIQTGLPMPDSPGHRRTVSTPTRIDYVDPSTLSLGRPESRPVSGMLDASSTCAVQHIGRC